MIERTLFFYPGQFLPASAGIERRAELILDYLLLRSRELAVILVNASPKSVAQVESRLAGRGSVKVLDGSRNRVSRAKRNLVRIYHQGLRGQISPFDSIVFLPAPLRQAFSVAARSFSPTVAVITYVSYAGLISSLPESTATILDAIDIYQRVHRAYADDSRLKTLLAPIRFGYREQPGVYDSERRILARYQGVLAISREDERAYIAAGLEAGRIGFLEACVRELALTPSASSRPKDLDILFIGARFPGTEKGLWFLLREVVPRIARRLRVAIVGRVGEVLAGHPALVPTHVSVETPGVVDDVNQFYDRARVVAIPIPLGTGTSVKAQEAFSRGACVVTTTAGARVQGVVDGENCLIRDAPLPFARAIEELLQQPERRASLGTAALQTARRYYSVDSVYAYLDDFIQRSTGVDPHSAGQSSTKEKTVGL